MTEAAAQLVWLAIGAYAAAGFAVALCVAAFGLSRLTPTARDMPLKVRALILPGLTALWPLVVLLLIRGPKERPR